MSQTMKFLSFKLCVQVASDTMDTMKQEIKVLDTKINGLSNFFQKQCKMKDDASYDVTLASIQDNLIKRKRCRLVRQDLQVFLLAGSLMLTNSITSLT